MALVGLCVQHYEVGHAGLGHSTEIDIDQFASDRFEIPQELLVGLNDLWFVGCRFHKRARHTDSPARDISINILKVTWPNFGPTHVVFGHVRGHGIEP